MKKKHILLIGICFSFSLLFLLPFFFYWISKLGYFLFGLIDSYSNFLLKYFSPDSVDLLVVFTGVVFVSSLFSLIYITFEESLYD